MGPKCKQRGLCFSILAAHFPTNNQPPKSLISILSLCYSPRNVLWCHVYRHMYELRSDMKCSNNYAYAWNYPITNMPLQAAPWTIHPMNSWSTFSAYLSTICVWDLLYFISIMSVCWSCTVYADELDWWKQYNTFIPVIDAALLSTVMDRRCYNAAINKISTSADANFSFGGILNTGNSFALSEPELAGWVR